MDSERLRHLLSSAADAYEPPPRRPRRVIESRRGEARSWPRRRALQVAGIAATVAVLLVALGLAITTGRGPNAASSAQSDATGAGGARSAAPGTAGATGSAGTSGTTGSGRTARVVQTGQVSLEVGSGKVQPALDRLGAIATSVGGYLSESRVDSGTGTPSGTSTLRVPVASFAGVLSQVRRIGHVTSTSTQARDVTAEYVDVAARISALEQTRATFLTLLSKAATIGDTLAVQQQIQPVQTHIEQLQGQQKLLADTSDLATLAVSVSQAGAAPAPATHRSAGFAKALHQAVHGFNTGLQAIITVAGPLLLAVLVLGVLALIGRLGYRTVRRWQA